MARIYAEQPPPGPIELALAGKTPLERAVIRAGEHNKLQPGDSFVLDGIEVQLLQPIKLNKAGTGIQLDLRARVAATGELLPVEHTGYRFLNPPVKVPNGTWRTLPDGVDVENCEERPMEALKRMVLDAVLFYARRKGWVG